MKLTIETANDLPRELYDAIVAHLVKHDGKLIEYPTKVQTTVFELKNRVAYASVHSGPITISFPPMKLAQPEQPAAEPQAKVPMLEWEDTFYGEGAIFNGYVFKAGFTTAPRIITPNKKVAWNGSEHKQGDYVFQQAEMQAVFEAHYDEFVAGTFGMPKDEQPPYPLDDISTWPNGTTCDYMQEKSTVTRKGGASIGYEGFIIGPNGEEWCGDSGPEECYNIRFPEQPDKVWKPWKPWKPWTGKEVAGE